MISWRDAAVALPGCPRNALDADVMSFSANTLSKIASEMLDRVLHWFEGWTPVASNFSFCATFSPMKLLTILLLLSCAALAQTPDLKTASGYHKMVQTQVSSWIERAAEKMPEEEYG